jgi:hypothetical protein
MGEGEEEGEMGDVDSAEEGEVGAVSVLFRFLVL